MPREGQRTRHVGGHSVRNHKRPDGAVQIPPPKVLKILQIKNNSPGEFFRCPLRSWDHHRRCTAHKLETHIHAGLKFFFFAIKLVLPLPLCALAAEGSPHRAPKWMKCSSCPVSPPAPDIMQWNLGSLPRHGCPTSSVSRGLNPKLSLNTSLI